MIVEGLCFLLFFFLFFFFGGLFPSPLLFSLAPLFLRCCCWARRRLRLRMPSTVVCARALRFLTARRREGGEGGWRRLMARDQKRRTGFQKDRFPFTYSYSISFSYQKQLQDQTIIVGDANSTLATHPQQHSFRTKLPTRRVRREKSESGVCFSL